MNTIVCNTLSGAVTEYAGFSFHAITPTHAGDASGLYALGGETDPAAPIVADVHLPPGLRGTSLKKHIDSVYLSMHGEGAAQFTVYGRAGQWSYTFPLRASGQTRCVVGRGIRENYLGFSVRTPDGQQFTIDRIELALVRSQSRRV